jgi:hypothetical protein
MNTPNALMTAVCVAFFVACAPQEPGSEQADAYETSPQPTPEVSQGEFEGTEDPTDLSPIEAEARIDAVTVGHEVAADGSIPDEQVADEFEAGEPIHLAMAVDDTPAGSAVEVVWLGPRDARIGEQLKTVEDGQTYLSFETPDTADWAEGRYRAEVWIGDEKVATERFKIVAAGEGEAGDDGMGG